ncbi:hypothetical protein [Labilibaculum sp.]|uniref:hypothetical protein n=1 Tax=Labilibaculum sp. TaxID=2060723 RepID=UPI002AA6013B|nr:hypothetical protein [Labilibaculum sp.]MBN2598195.1 hypothetical protein [Marinifilaceae bacterium]
MLTSNHLHFSRVLSIYQNASLAVYYAQKGDTKKAIEHLDLFSKGNNYQYWFLLFFEIDPLVDNIKDLPEFKKIMKRMKTTFWNDHKKIKLSLEKKELLLIPVQ